MLNPLLLAKQLIQGKPFVLRRSSQWPSVRAIILKEQKVCAACGAKKKLEVHHIKPFHLFPDLELSASNLIVLCEGAGCNCHFTFGHLLNWKSYNPSVIDDAEAFRSAVQNRPISSPRGLLNVATGPSDLENPESSSIIPRSIISSLAQCFKL